MIRLDATAWVRIGAAAFVVGALGATAAQFGRDDGRPPAPPAALAPVSRDLLAPELQRCRLLSPTSPPDTACEQVWAKVRARFFAPGGDGARP